mgnify:CR=1 FL=1
MNEKLKEKVKESLSSVLPITLIVLVLSVTLVPMEIGTLALFLTGAVLLIVGMGFFQLGAEMSMTPLGEGVGKTLAKRKKVLLVVLVAFALGTIITIAEPDLQVLANQVASIPNNVLIWTVAVGVGVFLALAVLRILFRVSLAKCLLAAYALLFVLTLFSPKEFLAVAFDAGGVTTGPITVPFIMALGVGVSVIRSTQGHDDDSFGLVALCSVGPILMVLLLGIGAVMMYVGGIRNYWVGLGFAMVLLVIYAFATGIITYNSSRIDIWLDPFNEEWMRDKGYQIRQSLLSIGSGGLFGLGLGKSRQKFLFLPEEHNDFIFAIICEELGLVGATIIMVMFALLIIRGYWIALHARDRFGSLLAVGVTTQIALQVFLNIAVVTNLIPNTGISLPFFSYGGTALAVQLAEVGIVLSVSRQMR